MASRKIYFLLQLLRVCLCYQQEFILYSESGFSGDALVLRSKRSELLSLSPEIVRHAKSYCFRGMWKFYEEENFYGKSVKSNGLISTICHANSKYIRLSQPPFEKSGGSARYLGSLETNHEAIAFYEEEDFDGLELIIDRNAYGNINFSPRSFFATGNSNWTFFAGTNFDGEATCVMPSFVDYNYFTLKASLTGVRSILKGCGTDVRNYISMGDMAK